MLGFTSCTTDVFRGRQFFGLSENFAKGKFLNEEMPAPRKKRSFKDHLSFGIEVLRRGGWPKYFHTQEKQILRVREEGLRVYFINHATCLIQMEKYNILTDPVWSNRVSPFTTVGPKRVTNPGIKFEDLPPIDIVLLSHDHYDHLDIETLLKLNKQFSPKFFVGLGVEKLLKKHGITKVYSMDWWDCIAVENDLCVNFVPSQHFSGRGVFDRNSTLWGGFVVTGRNSTMYFAGDTGYSKKQFSDISQKFSNIDVAIMPIGAYDPVEYMQYVHMNPYEAVLAHQILKPKKSIPIHYATFRLTLEKYEDPAKELKKSLDLLKISRDQFPILNFGDSILIK